MKKITKGAIAAGAAALLLVGGGGTFMSWNDDATMTEQGINAGSLALEQGASSWALNGNDLENIETAAIVPGDILEFSQQVEYTTVGNDIEATLSVTPGSIAAQDSDSDTDKALAEVLTNTAVVEIENQDSEEDGSYTIQGDAQGIVTAVARIEFPFGEDVDNATQLGEVNLAGMTVSFEQVQRS